MNLRYKIGDKVKIKSLDWYNENKDNYGAVYVGNGFAFWNYMARHCGEIMEIAIVKVDPENSNKGYYFMENSEERWTDEMIEGLVEDETSIKLTGKAIKNDEMVVGIGEWNLPKGYIFKDENGNVINATKIVLEKIKKEYPKTYKECLAILNYNIGRVSGYKASLLAKLQDLLVCRDAYWKIYGEQMGLGKPWKPDFTNDDEERYGIYTAANKVVKDFCGVGDVNTILTFPTEEMRDAFYENFKDLIEQCKELL